MTGWQHREMPSVKTVDHLGPIVRNRLSRKHLDLFFDGILEKSESSLLERTQVGGWLKLPWLSLSRKNGLEITLNGFKGGVEPTPNKAILFQI